MGAIAIAIQGGASAAPSPSNVGRDAGRPPPVTHNLLHTGRGHEKGARSRLLEGDMTVKAHRGGQACSSRGKAGDSGSALQHPTQNGGAEFAMPRRRGGEERKQRVGMSFAANFPPDGVPASARTPSSSYQPRRETAPERRIVTMFSVPASNAITSFRAAAGARKIRQVCDGRRC